MRNQEWERVGSPNDTLWLLEEMGFLSLSEFFYLFQAVHNRWVSEEVDVLIELLCFIVAGEYSHAF